ncbi:hypothetical protein, partial [Clostridium butyricum]
FPLTFQHRAGVSPYTSAYALAETCVFVKQLLVPILCGLPIGRPQRIGTSNCLTKTQVSAKA